MFSLLERRFLCGNLGRTCAAGGGVVELDLHLLQRRAIFSIIPEGRLEYLHDGGY